MNYLDEATPEEIKRFFSFVDKLPNGCWFWGGARSRGKGNKKWYGSFKVKRNGKWRTVRAHAYASDVIGKRGPLPEGYDRDHICRFSLCVRLEHIEVVTKQVNAERRHANRVYEPEVHFDG